MLTDLIYLHQQYFEIQEKDCLTSSTNVTRLTEHIEFRELLMLTLNLKKEKTLQEAYQISFINHPVNHFSKTNTSDLKNMEFVEEAVF